MIDTIPLSLLGIIFIVTLAIISTTTTGAPLETISQSMLYISSQGRNRTSVKEDFRFETDIDVEGDLDAKTTKSMSSPRCGVNDNVGIHNNSTRSKRYAIWDGHWTFYNWGQINVTYDISKYPKKLSHQKVDKVIAKAINVWSKYTDLTFTVGKSESWLLKRADIAIAFEKIDGRHGVLANVDFYDNVTFDDAEDWRDEWKLFSVAVHEFGHTLGLDHTNVPSTFSNATTLPFQFEPEIHFESR